MYKSIQGSFYVDNHVSSMVYNMWALYALAEIVHSVV